MLGLVAITALVLAPLGTSRAQDYIPHLVLLVMKDSANKVFGYKVHHEIHKVTYVALLGPTALAELERCRLDNLRRLAVLEGEGPPTYEGLDGRPCSLARFAPDVPGPDQSLPPREPFCPGCPNR